MQPQPQPHPTPRSHVGLADTPRSPTHEELSALICEVRAGRDRQAFSVLFMHFAPRVKGYLVRLGTPVETADELAQETMLVVWRRTDLFDPTRAALSTWIFTIARNLRIDLHRRTGTKAAITDSCSEGDGDLRQPVDLQPGPDEQLNATQVQQCLRDALAELPAQQRKLLLQSFFNDRPQSEIARELGIPLNTIKTQLRRAVAQLRRKVHQLRP